MAVVGGARPPAMVVAAIDFGTTYSGWAFSFRHEFDSDPVKVSAKQWAGGQLVSPKGPTCVLIKPDGKTFHSFGYDAESKYAELAEQGEHERWYFFKRFKMMLFDKVGIERSIMLEDAVNKKLSAHTIFSLSIRFLKDDLLAMSDQRIAGGGLKTEDVHWVLTVPAIWNDGAKQFMREAAEEAGIPGDMLTIALEPEAASLYCRHLPVEKSGGDSSMCLAQFRQGTKYMVLDAGGGTVDITVHEVMAGGKLKELHKASGGAWGGTQVDEAFKQFLIKLVGAPVWKKFQQKSMEDYIDMFRDFEVKKRDIGPKKTGKVTLRIPSALTELFCEMTDETLKEAIPNTRYAQQIILSGDKLRIDVDVVKGFFKQSVDSVLSHVDNLLKLPKVQGCAAIVMVGGFGESPLLQDAVRRQFSGTRVIVPVEAGLAVLKGAVIFGHSPKIISERVAKFTYGISCESDFIEGVHKSCKKVIRDNEVKVSDQFSRHVQIGETLKVDDAQSLERYGVARAEQTGATVEFYTSTCESPSYIDDSGCVKIGEMTVDIPGYGKDRHVTVSLLFGQTEIFGIVTCEQTGKTTRARINFLK